LSEIPEIWKSEGQRVRHFVEAVAWILRTGTAWADLPSEFGKPDSVHRRLRRWAAKGIWEWLFMAGIPDTPVEVAMIDFTSRKVHRSARSSKSDVFQEIGQSRGGLNTKIHLVCDGNGWILAFGLTEGQAADCAVALDLLAGILCKRLLADRGYDTNDIRDQLCHDNVEAVIPSKITVRRRKEPNNYAAFICLALTTMNRKLCP
jgi:transposase